MKPIEEQIIKEIESLDLENLKSVDLYDLEDLMKILTEQFFGNCTTEFINHPSLDYFSNKIEYNNQNYFLRYYLLLIRIEDYLINKNDNSKAQEKLDKVEMALKFCLTEFTPQARARGTAMLPRILTDKEFIEKIYLLNDNEIHSLFAKYLPMPRTQVFSINSEFIAKKEQDSMQTIKNLLNRLESKKQKLSAFEKGVVKVQRNFRANRRKRENINRVAFRYNITEKQAKQILDDANKPYVPQCDSQLADRILKAAEEVTLFFTVKHFTAGSALESIFDDGLYGRKSLREFYMPFKAASLFQFDIDEGDGNVICFGANEIDPGAKKNGIELEFDSEKISKNNPCIFFKQRDLGFTYKKIRDIKIGDVDLFFSHTDKFDERNLKVWQQYATSEFQLFSEKNSFKHYSYAAVKNSSLVAYNLEEMHKILALNFFRYIDNLHDKNLENDHGTKDKIYAELGKLDHKALVETLQEIGKKISDTMEFNFYGAYQIDFSALLYIKDHKLGYNLHLPTLIKKLNTGDVEALNEARDKLPEIFKSHRFVNYLISKVKDKSIGIELQKYLDNCHTPAWLSYKKS